MRKGFFSWPIRAHLAILIAVLAVPSIGLIVYSGIAERHEAIADGKAECLKFVNDVAGQQQAIAAGAEQLATALSLLSPIRSLNPVTATPLLSELLRKNPQYANIIVCDKSGLVRASAIPTEGKVSLADRTFFQKAARTGMFSPGEYAMARIVKRPIITFGYPVKQTANKLIAVIGITLDLDYIRHMFEHLNLPPGSLFALLDDQGTILMRSLNDPLSGKLIGGRDIRQDLFTRMREGADEGTYEAIGNDEKPRLAAYKKLRLPNESEPYLYIRSSIPLASAISKANITMFSNLAVFVSLFIIGLFLAWLIGSRLIVNPATALKKAAGRLAAGVDNVNVASIVKGGELGEVARAFDSMAERLIQEKAALRASEQRWATTLSSIGDAVIATDVEGKITFMNAVAEGLTGWTLQEAAARPVTEVFSIINEQTRNQVENPVTKVLREGMTVGLANHTVLMKKDGSEVPIDDSGAPIKDEAGNTSGVVVIFRDVTERKRAEEALRESEERFKILTQATFEGVAITEQGRFVDGNDQLFSMLGYRREEMVGREVSEFIVPEDRAKVMDNILQGLEVIVEHGMIKRDGQPVTVEAHGKTETHHGRKVRLTALRDITERKRMEEELRRSRNGLEQRVWERTAELEESNERFHTLVELLPEIVFETDLNERYTYANRQAIETFGVTSEKLREGLYIRDLVAEKDYGRIKQNMNRILKGEALPGGEYTVRRNDGSEFPVFIRASRTERNGKVTGVRGIVIDLTESRRAEEERMRLEEQLRQAQKMEALGTLAGGIAHDFNNMLAVIIGNAELALDDIGDGSDGADHRIKQILMASQRARDLVKEILAFSRKSQGRRKPFKLGPLVQETANFLRGSLPSMIKIEVDTRSDLDAVLADVSQVQQVIMNLSTNAADAINEDGGLLFMGVSDAVFGEKDPKPDPDMQTGRYVVLTVRDTGAGMPKQVLCRIFEPFFTTKEQGKGSGMGLAVVFGIVKAHNGAITVKSRPGKGTTFKVFFPSHQEAVQEEPIQQAALLKGTERVLVVDDEPAVVEMTSDTLKRLGYQVTTAGSGHEGWEKFEKAPGDFDLVLTDHVMPDLTGMRLAEKMLELRKDMPIILFTGYSETVSPQKAKAAGIAEFLYKPVVARDLAETVSRVLHARDRISAALPE